MCSSSGGCSCTYAAYGTVTFRGGLSIHSLRENSSCVPTGHQEISLRVTVPYAARIQLYPPEDEHLGLETCRGEYYFMNK